MSLSYAQDEEFIKIIKELLVVDQVQEMMNYIQHGKTSTFTHCLIVAYLCYQCSLRTPFHYDTKSLIRGAMLHDFYLYDWHIPDKSHRLHGYYHAGFALKNARKHFKLNRIEEEIIEKHMWPLNISKLPFSKEAILVCGVDKYVSLAETFHISVVSSEYERLHKMLFETV